MPQYNIQLIDYTPTYRSFFKSLNEEWLKKYFQIEKIDNDVLSNPEKFILDPGGFIFFAIYNHEVVGTCALMKASNHSLELTKMAVTEKYQGFKIGEKLVHKAIEVYQKSSATSLFLESNSKLTSAIRLYEKVGFQHKKRPFDSHYQRADVYMEYLP